MLLALTICKAELVLISFQAERVGGVCVKYTVGMPGQQAEFGTTIFVRLLS